jgi:hypothetical protein
MNRTCKSSKPISQLSFLHLATPFLRLPTATENLYMNNWNGIVISSLLLPLCGINRSGWLAVWETCAKHADCAVLDNQFLVKSGASLQL